MSTREILAELSQLTAADLQAVEERIAALRIQSSAGSSRPPRPEGGLRAERIEGRLVLVADRVIHQSEVQAVLDDFP